MTARANGPFALPTPPLAAPILGGTAGGPTLIFAPRFCCRDERESTYFCPGPTQVRSRAPCCAVQCLGLCVPFPICFLLHATCFSFSGGLSSIAHNCVLPHDGLYLVTHLFLTHGCKSHSGSLLISTRFVSVKFLSFVPHFGSPHDADSSRFAERCLFARTLCLRCTLRLPRVVPSDVLSRKFRP